MFLSNPVRYAVIGAGILGVAIARQILINEPRSSVTIYEKEAHVAQHQSGHNSGVIHAGLYYTPGSLKAELCRRGSQLLQEYAIQHGVEFNTCGKLVIATNEAQLPHLANIYQRAQQNHVPQVQKISAEKIAEIEPHAVGLGAVHSPQTGIIDYRQLTEALKQEVEHLGGVFKFQTEVRGIQHDNDSVIVESDHGTQAFDSVITCAGLQSDRLARKSGGQRFPKIVPFSGDYYVLNENKSELVRGLIYPVPDPNFPFLGVHLTKTLSGETTVGPNAFLSFNRENYRNFSFNIRDSFEIANFFGFWRFAAKNSKTIFNQLSNNSKRSFAAGASAFIPKITKDDLDSGPRGIRAQAMDHQGRLLDDFAIDRDENMLHIRNAPSPAATASLAIAEYIVQTYL